MGKIEKSDWNMAAIEKKIHESAHGADVQLEREKVPKWSKDVYEDKVMLCVCVCMYVYMYVYI